MDVTWDHSIDHSINKMKRRRSFEFERKWEKKVTKNMSYKQKPRLNINTKDDER